MEPKQPDCVIPTMPAYLSLSEGLAPAERLHLECCGPLRLELLVVASAFHPSVFIVFSCDSGLLGQSRFLELLAPSAYFYSCSTFCVKSRFPDRLVGRSVAECLPNTKKTLRSNPSTTQNIDFLRHRSRRLAHLGGDRRVWKWMMDDGDTLYTCKELSEDTKLVFTVLLIMFVHYLFRF